MAPGGRGSPSRDRAPRAGSARRRRSLEPEHGDPPSGPLGGGWWGQRRNGRLSAVASTTGGRNVAWQPSSQRGQPGGDGVSAAALTGPLAAALTGVPYGCKQPGWPLAPVRRLARRREAGAPWRRCLGLPPLLPPRRRRGDRSADRRRACPRPPTRLARQRTEPRERPIAPSAPALLSGGGGTRRPVERRGPASRRPGRHPDLQSKEKIP